MHLSAAELVDIAEGIRPDTSAPHLAGCEACRAQLRELRAMMSATEEAVVPEPSPLFWDHLSSRVREAVAEEGAPRRAAWPTAWSDGPAKAGHYLISAIGVAALAVVLLAVALKPGTLSPRPVTAPPAVAVADAAPGIEPLRDVWSDEDASLALVASLSDHVDLDTVREAGLATRGSAEEAVTRMSEGELRELGRLLKEELARSGA